MLKRILPLVITLGVLGACTSTQQLVSGHSNECATLPWHGAPVDGTVARLRQCSGRNNQFWRLTPTGQITGIGGSCLDVEGGAPLDGARVISAACNPAPGQHWGFNNGQLVGIGGKCLDSPSGVEEDGVPLIIAPCTQGSSQHWAFH